MADALGDDPLARMRSIATGLAADEDAAPPSSCSGRGGGGGAGAQARLTSVARSLKQSARAAQQEHGAAAEARRRLEKVARDASWAARAGTALTSAAQARGGRGKGKAKGKAGAHASAQRRTAAKRRPHSAKHTDATSASELVPVAPPSSTAPPQTATQRARTAHASRHDLVAHYARLTELAGAPPGGHFRAQGRASVGGGGNNEENEDPATAVELEENLRLRQRHNRERLKLLGALEGGLDALALVAPPFSLDMRGGGVHTAGRALEAAGSVVSAETAASALDHVDAAVALSMRRGKNIFRTFRGGRFVEQASKQAVAMTKVCQTHRAEFRPGSGGRARATLDGVLGHDEGAVGVSYAVLRDGSRGSPRRVPLAEDAEGRMVVLDPEAVHLRRAAGVLATDTEVTGREHEAMWRGSLRKPPSTNGPAGDLFDGVSPVFARSLVAYKVVAVLYDDGGNRRLFSIFDGVTEYRLGIPMTNHSNGFFVYEDPLHAVKARVPPTSALKDCKRALLRVLASGKGYRRGRALAFPHLTPVAVLEEVDPLERSFVAAFAATYGRATSAYRKQAVM